MFSIASHIEYLLLTHQCVVAPGLGAFLVHESPSFYDEASGHLLPPSRTVGFNSAVTLNDGLLAQSVARKERISIESARARVESAVEAFRSQLRESQALPFGNLGDMTLSGGAILFEPSATSAVSFACRGLEPLPLDPLAESTDSEPLTPQPVPAARPAVFTLGLRIAASLILVLLGCGIFLTTGNLFGPRDSQRASLDSGLRASIPSVTPAPPGTEVPAVETTLPVSREIQLNIARPAEAPAAETEPAAVSAEPGRYLLVVGSFPTLKAASRFADTDTSLRIIEMEGRFRIYAASAKTYTEASRLADTVRADHPSVWICRR